MFNEYGKIIIPYSGDKEIVKLSKGYWRFELWGAASGSSFYREQTANIGLGAYVSGELSLYHPLILYCYVGGKGGDNQGEKGGTAGFNGGSVGGNDDVNNNCGSGWSGGATDVRLEDDLYSRIIVAGGGGSPGCASWSSDGGHGGTISGINGSPNKAATVEGGKGGYISIDSLFGIGEKGTDGNEAAGSGGGGYFAGEGGVSAPAGGAGGGGGGSSYASGCDGCKTLLKTSKLGTNVHPSLIIFHNISMVSGNETTIPTFTHSQIDYASHSEHGLIVITKLWDIYIHTCEHHFIHHIFSIYILIQQSK